MKLTSYWFIAVIALAISVAYVQKTNLKPSVKATTDTSAGLYFDEMGQIFFSPTQWKVVSYVDLKPTQVLWKQVKAHQLQINNYCMKIQNATWCFVPLPLGHIL